MPGGPANLNYCIVFSADCQIAPTVLGWTVVGGPFNTQADADGWAKTNFPGAVPLDCGQGGPIGPPIPNPPQPPIGPPLPPPPPLPIGGPPTTTPTCPPPVISCPPPVVNCPPPQIIVNIPSGPGITPITIPVPTQPTQPPTPQPPITAPGGPDYASLIQDLIDAINAPRLEVLSDYSWRYCARFDSFSADWQKTVQEAIGDVEHEEQEEIEVEITQAPGNQPVSERGPENRNTIPPLPLPSPQTPQLIDNGPGDNK